MVPPEATRARFPVTELFAGRFTKLASIPRFATVIVLPVVAITEPLVRKAKVLVPVGAIAAVMLIVPELVPSTAPILTLLAESRFSSAATKESFPLVGEPRSISRLSVRGEIVITPEGAETVLFSSIASASNKTSPEFEVMVPELVIELP